MKLPQHLLLCQAIYLSLLCAPPASAQAGESPQAATGGEPTDLQALVTTETLQVNGLQLTLRNLNHSINKWFILEVRGAKHLNLHLENRNAAHSLSLAAEGLNLKVGDGPATLCRLWNNAEFDLTTVNFVSFPQTYYPLCQNNVYVRLKKSSNTSLSATERATELLRQTKFGEGIISAIKPYMVTLEGEAGDIVANKGKRTPRQEVEGPRPPKMEDEAGKSYVSLHNRLGFTLANNVKEVEFGDWYKVAMHEGVYVSLFKPELIAKSIFASFRDRVQFLKNEELDKLVYMTAYDLNRYSINYAIGTEHPAVNTSAEIYGAANAAWRQHLVPIGSIPPYELADGIGVFVGGFKNRHGRFGRGLFIGKTYGYIENGVELEPMSGGLATTFVTTDGQVDIAPWPEKPAELMAMRRKVVAARQNGLMMMERGEPSPYIGDWHNGNWSADVNGLGRSLRSAVCLQDEGDKKYLIFMAFTSATPSSMARVMQAYQCRVAMHLDMNAYMYLHNALYRWDAKGGHTVEYLHKDMLYPEDLKYHRFIMDNNSRDFFYVTRRHPGQP